MCFRFLIVSRDFINWMFLQCPFVELNELDQIKDKYTLNDLQMLTSLVNLKM